MRHILCLLILIAVLFLFSGCAEKQVSFFSFEHDMEGWNVNGTDLELDDSTIYWTITRSQERAKDGNTSVKFALDNLNDAGKIWMERPFIVESNHTYRVTVEYAFASADFGNFNLFKIITGVQQNPPQTGDDLVDIYNNNKDHTGNGDSSDLGYKWLNKKYEFTTQSGEDGRLYVVIGIWGTWETYRTYYFDSVRVTLT